MIFLNQCKSRAVQKVQLEDRYIIPVPHTRASPTTLGPGRGLDRDMKMKGIELYTRAQPTPCITRRNERAQE